MKRLLLALALVSAACGLTVQRGHAPVYVPPVVTPWPDAPVVSETPRRPTRAEVLTYKGHLANLHDSAGRIIWTPALPGAPADVRKEWLKAIADNGGTHVPIGGFTPGPAYPGVEWSNPDWTRDAAAIRGLVLEILNTPTQDGHGMVPVIFTDGGPREPLPRLRVLFPTLAEALDGLDDSVIVVPAGWEPVVGDFTSYEVSWALMEWHKARPNSIIGYHGSPARLVGSSNPIEVTDPWQGGESAFYQAHGGQYIDIALYQTPHGRSLYEPCSVESDDCWLNRWNDYVVRIGGGFHGWRVLPIVLFESCAYEAYRGQVTHEQCRDVARRAKAVCDAAQVTCGFGNGLP